MLSAAEYQRWQRFVFARDRDRFLLARALVRSVLGQYLHVPPASLVFSANRWGKPELDPAAHPGHCLQFNLSHTTGLAVLAVSQGVALGVDVEDVRREVEMLALARRYFAVQEVEELQSLPEAQQRERFFALWTLKEAYVKARGLGMHLSLQSFGFTFSTGQAPGLHHPDQPTADAQWGFGQLDFDTHFRIAVSQQIGGGQPLNLQVFTGVPLVEFEALPECLQ